MKITAKDLKEFGIVDEIVPEPEGGAHTDYEATAGNLDDILSRQLAELSQLSPKELVQGRYEKFRKMGQYFDFVGR
jgi:acetyl-CoA carboxylase carboxyl transferase subunit alpha